MERQVVENYETRALGFTIIIKRVELEKFRDEWVPRINWDVLQHVALWALAHKPAPLSGNEVRFVRTYMNKTLQEFAALCEVSAHQTVMNWESKGDAPTGMTRSTEIVLRARILEAAPAWLWETYHPQNTTPRAVFSETLAEVSRFEPKPSEPLSLLPSDGNLSEIVRYAYA